MVRKSASILLSLLPIVFSLSSSIAFDSNPNKINPNDRNDPRQRPYTRQNSIKPFDQGGYYGGHDTITAEAMALKKQVHSGDKAFGDWADLNALPNFRTGVHDEDSTIGRDIPFIVNKDEWIGPNGADGGWTGHFYNPYSISGLTGHGLFGIEESAPAKVRRYVTRLQELVACRPGTSQDPSLNRSVNDYLGRIMHLYQDVHTPAHVKGGWFRGQYLHFLNTPFEKYVSGNWDKIINSRTFQQKVTVENYRNGAYEIGASVNPETAMREAAKKTYQHPDDWQLYDIKLDPFGQPVQILNQDKLRDAAESLVSEAILDTAGYMDSIYQAMNAPPDVNTCRPQNPTRPGGDHPDERFDVSTWASSNTQFGMSEHDILGFFMRTALKKGSTGPFYLKRLMEVYAEGKSLPDDANEETKTAVEDEFNDLLTKLRNTPEARIDISPDIAVLEKGFVEEMTGLINKHKEPVRIVPVDLSLDIVKDHPVLVIPSGGLSGMDKSEFFKASLDQYVESGGTLIVFAQQQGYEYSAIPVPEEPDGARRQVAGYGWNQDQNCFTNAVFIKSWHQIFAGQSRTTPTLNVDGYFTAYPSSASVLLTRTANGQPAAIMYDYGQGKVVVTSLYSDFAFGHSQASQEEIALVRDLISWAKKPTQLPETGRGGTVSVPLVITNSTDTNAASVKVVVYAPDRSSSVSEQTIETTLPAGASTEITIQYSAPSNAPLGIYHGDYILLDNDGNVAQPQTEADSGRFVVSSPPKTGMPDKDLWFSVSTPSQEVTFGSPMEYTLHIYNNTDRTRSLTIGTDLWHTHRSRTWSVTAGPMGETTVSGSDPFTDSYYMFETLHAYVQDESGKRIASYDLSFKALEPKTKIGVSTDKTVYGGSEAVTIRSTLTSEMRMSTQFTVKTSVYGPTYHEVFREEKTVDLPAYGTGVVGAVFGLPAMAPPGFYLVKSEVWSANRLVASEGARLEVFQSQVSLTPALPETYVSGVNVVSFTLANEGRIPVRSGLIEVALTAPEGGTVYTDTTQVALAIGETRAIEFSVSIPSPKLGTYALSYAYSDETRTGNPVTVIIPNRAVLSMALDKSTYRIRESANLAVTISNTGRFDLADVQLTMAAPDMDYSNTTTVSLPAGGNTTLPYAIPIPEAVAEGAHTIDGSMGLLSGSILSGQSSFTVLPSSLMVLCPGPGSVGPGETIRLHLENGGGFATEFATEGMKITDENGVTLCQGSASGSVRGGETVQLADLQIPTQTALGTADVTVRVRDKNSGAISEFRKSIQITGLTASMTSRTDKSAYVRTESPVGLADVTTGLSPIEGAKLETSVYRVMAGAGGSFSRAVPKSGWAPAPGEGVASDNANGFLYTVRMCDDGTGSDIACILKFDRNLDFLGWWRTEIRPGEGEAYYYAHGIALDADGAIYIGDGKTSQIYKYSGDGALITKWGSYGQGNGQFRSLNGITIGNDGFVYAVDSWSGVQKFDRNGGFIARLPETSGNYWPFGIAVSDDGFLYLNDSGYDRIWQFDGAGNLMAQWRAQDHGGEEFFIPMAMATGPDGSLYVADCVGNRIQRFDGSGNFIGKWGSCDLNGATYAFWQQIAVDSDGFVYFVGSDKLMKFDSNLTLVTTSSPVSPAEGNLDFGARGLAVDGSGNIYVSDHGRVQRFDGSGNLTAVWGSSVLGSSYGIGRVAAAPDGSVYVAAEENYVIKIDANGNYVNSLYWSYYPAVAVGPDSALYVAYSYWPDQVSSVQKYDGEGNLITRWGSYGTGDGQFSSVGGIAVSRDGFVYIVDANNNRVQKFDGQGNFVTSFGGYGTGDGQFNTPAGITIGADDCVYVADRWNLRVQKFDGNGNFIASLGGYGFGDGQFYTPVDVAAGPDGAIYVLEDYNGRVQKFTSSTKQVLFQAARPITQSANATQQYVTEIGTLNSPGKFYLSSLLRNSLGQKLAEKAYPFYVARENTIVAFSTDKQIYRPGEAIGIAGDVRNLAPIAATGLSLVFTRQVGAGAPETLATFTFDAPANGTFPFSVNTQALTEGTCVITATVTQNGRLVADAADQYLVAPAKVAVDILAPVAVGSDPFAITVQLKNEGLADANVTLDTTLDGQAQTLAIPTGTTKTLTYSGLTITGDTEYTFALTGDVNQTTTRLVRYGLSTGISIEAAALYPEGRIALPVRFTNNGLLDQTLTIDASIHPGETISKTYFIPRSQSISDVFFFDLIEGDYAVVLNSQIPSASVRTTLFVRKETSASIAPLAIGPAAGLLTISTNAVNTGCYPVEGTVRVSVTGAGDVVVWQASQAVSLPPGQSPLPVPASFSFNSSALPPGGYSVIAELLDGSGRKLSLQAAPLTIKGSQLQLAQVPSPQTVNAGEEVTLVFKVTNTGGMEGAAELSLKAYDLIELTRREWLGPGETRDFSFAFKLPSDLEERDYFADYELKGEQGLVTKGQARYHVAGIDLNVQASLDKGDYHEGEMARLTVSVSSSASRNLFARINYGTHENKQSFVLSGSQILTFDVPLTSITGEKLFYGVYEEGGRSIHLNSVFIHKADDVLSISTDKQVYNQGETVVLTIAGNPGTLTLSGPGFEETFLFTGAVSKGFTLPARATAGTYYIEGTLALQGETISVSKPFDIAGIQVKVKESGLDKGRYGSSDTIRLTMRIESNSVLPGLLKTWIVDPANKAVLAGENGISLSVDPTLLIRDYTVTSATSGMHRLIYGIYSDGLLLASGALSFDVGEAVLLGLATDKSIYPGATEPVIVKASLFGNQEATLTFEVDGASTTSRTVNLAGFSSLDVPLAVGPGSHTLKAILSSGELTSTKEVRFACGSDLSDLAPLLWATPPDKSAAVKTTVSIANQGGTNAAPTTVTLYDGDTLLATLPIEGLAAGQTKSVDYSWNVLGKSGEHSIKAAVDPGNLIVEFNRDNNTTVKKVTVPDVIMATETDKETCKTGEPVAISSTMTNLTPSTHYAALTLVTSIKDQSGSEVERKVSSIGLSPGATQMVAESWSTTTEGAYLISQTLSSNGSVMAQQTKSITLVETPGFTVRIDSEAVRVKQGEDGVFTVYVDAFSGWTAPVSLSIGGLPPGSTCVFTPAVVAPPAGSVLVIGTKEASTGTFPLSIVAQGTAGNETVTQTHSASLDISGFALEATPSAKTVKQQETAVFMLGALSMTGYVGDLTLKDETGSLRGMRITIDETNLTVPSETAVRVETSKYTIPGVYTIVVSATDGITTKKSHLSVTVAENPETLPGIVATPGPGYENQALVSLFTRALDPVLEFKAFNTRFGANAVMGDIDGDGEDEIIVAPGPDLSADARVRIYRKNGVFLTEQKVFDTRFGLTLAVGDIDGDWREEVIVGTGPGPLLTSRLKALSFNGQALADTGIDFMAFPLTFRSGVNVTVGDVDGDGVLEIIAGAGPGLFNPARVRVFKVDTSGGPGRWKTGSTLADFTVDFGDLLDCCFGVNVSAGDVNGDGLAEIITGAGPNPLKKPVVKVFNGDGDFTGVTFEAYPHDYRFGVSVATGDLDGDGIDEIITGPGPWKSYKTWVRVFKGDGTLLSNGFLAYPARVGYGVKISTGGVGGEQ